MYIELASVFRLKLDFNIEFQFAIAWNTVLRYLRLAWKIVKLVMR